MRVTGAGSADVRRLSGHFLPPLNWTMIEGREGGREVEMIKLFLSLSSGDDAGHRGTH